LELPLARSFGRRGRHRVRVVEEAGFSSLLGRGVSILTARVIIVLSATPFSHAAVVVAASSVVVISSLRSWLSPPLVSAVVSSVFPLRWLVTTLTSASAAAAVLPRILSPRIVRDSDHKALRVDLVVRESKPAESVQSALGVGLTLVVGEGDLLPVSVPGDSDVVEAWELPE
jgi:hypothetical protein